MLANQQDKIMTITPVKPRSHYRHYSNPDCQGSLMRATALWPGQEADVSKYDKYDRSCCFFCQEEPKKPKEVAVPAGLEVGSAYLDRMLDWDRAKAEEAWKHLSNGFNSTDDELIAFAKEYFGVDVVAVRTVFYFNQATGYDCPRIDYLYRK